MAEPELQLVPLRNKKVVWDHKETCGRVCCRASLPQDRYVQFVMINISRSNPRSSRRSAQPAPAVSPRSSRWPPPSPYTQQPLAGQPEIVKYSPCYRVNTRNSHSVYSIESCDYFTLDYYLFTVVDVPHGVPHGVPQHNPALGPGEPCLL